MNDELVKQVISFIFKRSGKKQISESDIYLTLSMELKWCPPHVAKSFVSEIEKASLIINEKEMISPSFNIDKISIPIDFRPSPDFFEEYKAEINKNQKIDIDQLLELIQQNLNLSKEQLTDAINLIQKEKMVNENVAILLLAKKANINIDPYLTEIEHMLLT